MSRLWTDKEVALLRKNYCVGGVPKVIESLERHGFTRSKFGVKQKARELRLRIGESPDLIPLVAVHPLGRQASPTAVQRAKEDGVLTVLRMGRRRQYMVPIPWADEYVPTISDRFQAERLKGTWYSTREAAEVLGVNPTMLCRAVGREASKFTILGPIVAQVRRERWGAGKGLFLWEPNGVRAAAVQYRQQLREAA